MGIATLSKSSDQPRSPEAPAPRVSVVMAVFNGERYIHAAVRSVLDQDLRDLELIVVDDASSDSSADIVASFRDTRIVYSRNGENHGQTRSLNTGLRMARAPYVARMDADDEYLPGKLQAQVDFMEANPDVAVCGTWAECVDEQGVPSGIFRPPATDRDVAFRLVWTSPICHVSVLMRRDAVMDVGGYDEGYRYAADYRLWSELAMRGFRVVNIPRTLTRYRVFPGSFGAASMLGDAGMESAQIIQENARVLGSVQLPVDDARAIHLRAHPTWGDEGNRLTAYRSLKAIAGGVYRRVPARVRVELFAGFVWSIARGPVKAGTAHPRSLSERAGVILGRSMRAFGSDRLAGIKAAVTGLVRSKPT
ncbi:MAG: glycosyltransferase [Gemmatimonadota bacterium]|nr:glycosyltransferase [Gemmatimonadota bacterium]